MGQGLGEDLRGAWSDDDALFAPRQFGVERGVLGAQGADDIGLTGDDGQLLGDVVPDGQDGLGPREAGMPGAANQPVVLAQGLFLFSVEINDSLHPRQMLWQGLAHRLGLGGRRCDLGGWGRRLDEGSDLLLQRRDVGFEFRLVEEPELIRGNAVAARAKALAREQHDLLEEVLNLLVAIGKDLGVLLLDFDQVITQPNDLGMPFAGVVWQ